MLYQKILNFVNHFTNHDNQFVWKCHTATSIRSIIPAVLNLFRLKDHLVNFISVRGPPMPLRVQAGPEAEKKFV